MSARAGTGGVNELAPWARRSAAPRAFLSGRLTPEVMSPLGEGGMGECGECATHDWGRDLALKVLPTEFVEDCFAGISAVSKQMPNSLAIGLKANY